MVETWHSCIDSELKDVEELMLNSLESDNPELTEMCHYVISSGGKRLRPALCILSYFANGGDDGRIPVKLGSAFEIIHTASLVHDDINDMGEMRRGRKALHKQYTVSKAIIAGDFMFAIGFNLLAGVAPRIVSYIVEASASMGAGEFVQKDFEHASTVTEESYLKIISGKTAKLFEASAKTGAAVLDDITMEQVDAMGQFAYNIGMAFQIVDDTLDVTGDINNTGKAVGTDLLEGKPTLPVIYAMEDKEKGPRIAELFGKVDVTEEDVKEAIGLIRATDSIKRCLARAEVFVKEAVAYVANLPESIYKNSMLAIANYIVSRDR